MQRKLIVLLTLTIIVSITLCGIRGQGQETLYIPDQEYIRFHVLANSDTPEDQALKYKVKDILVEEIEHKFIHSQSIEETRGILTNNLDEIARIGQEAVLALGSNYEVKAQYGNFSFPTKYYGNGFSLPAGTYEAVRVIIGEGQGANWWCVLFPPLCFVDTKAPGPGEELTPAKESSEKIQISFSFKIFEWLENSFSVLAKIFS
ncbi:MAG: stage II sporulation protein R [Clostridia bacterium]|jgi:stage II sporulation protein R|nr:stage II sporulation protein R [Clostridia bacterium]